MKSVNEVFDMIKEHSSDNLGDGESEESILAVEQTLGVKLPDGYRDFLKEIGYAELFGDEIYSIYPDDGTFCLGIVQQNGPDQEYLAQGFLKFFSNDLDGVFYINISTGKVYLNDTSTLYADGFLEFAVKLMQS